MLSVNEEIFDYLPKQQAIARMMEPQDLVGVVSFLCSSDAAFVTGQTIVADGGPGAGLMPACHRLFPSHSSNRS
jgi:NAD(P)-dependent dehydrogenase (short-subunit alcohol dehydrogenase family)